MPSWKRTCLLLSLFAIGPVQSVRSQVTSGVGQGAPDDTPTIRFGMTLFADYTVTLEPKSIDVDGNEFTLNAFNIARAYLNVTGNISQAIAFRVTPDIARETTTASSVNGGLTFRLKYAYGQFNLDKWMRSGSFARIGMQQTPWIDFIESVYRYRFQGPTMEDREGVLSSADVGAAFYYPLGGNYGDVHVGFYNGDGYNQTELNNQKALMARVTIRPFPTRSQVRGLRVTGFYDRDAYVKDAERNRGIVGLTYEHRYVNAGVNFLTASDQSHALGPKLDRNGFSVWATPKTPTGHGWEGLLRFDHLSEEQTISSRKGERHRMIGGIAYWFQQRGPLAAAILLDYERADNEHFVPVKADERRWALHTLISF
jgi:hypothetical protein